MNLQQLYYFKVAAEMQHYTKAAERLMISQPALSHAILELEKELEAPLFVKKGRNIQLTKYGDVFLKYILPVLDGIEIAKDKVGELKNPDSGTIILGYVSTVKEDFISNILSRFYQNPSHNSIKFELHLSSLKQIEEKFKQGHCDIGLVSDVKNSNFCLYPIYSEEMVAIVSRKHPFSVKTQISLEELGSEDFIAYEENTESRAYVDELFERIKIKPKIVCEAINEVMITSIVSANIGVSIVPKMYGAPYYNVKSLNIMDIDTKREIFMTWQNDDYISPVTKKFRDFVINDLNLK